MSKQKQNQNFVHKSRHVVSLQIFQGIQGIIILSYRGLTDARMRASEKDLSVTYFVVKGLTISISIITLSFKDGNFMISWKV